MKLAPIDYRVRLESIANELGDGALLALSRPLPAHSGPVAGPWRQDSFLHYLTGFEEPESALLVLPLRPEKERFIMFVREKDAHAELWDGRRLGVDKAREILKVDEVRSIRTLWDVLPDLLGSAQRLYCALGQSEDHDRYLISTLTKHKNTHGKRHLSAKLPVYDPQLLAGHCRLKKSPEEIERMRAAADITRKMFKNIYAAVRPGMNEREVHGLILHQFMQNGADGEAYGSIVAGGDRACVLHYRENNEVLKDGELLLIDAGAQQHQYASDVTRTFPIGRRFTSTQKSLYELVLRAQKMAIAKAHVGSTLVAVHDEAVSVLTEGLLDLGLLTGSKDEMIAQGGFRRFFPHGTSHWIGMDVHDVGLYYKDGKPVVLEPGMYFSVEPGLYIRSDDETVPKEYRGIGIRIEDDILVSPNGPEVLTSGIAKEVAELEDRY